MLISFLRQEAMAKVGVILMLISRQQALLMTEIFLEADIIKDIA
jgi:hypothetical protein